MSREWDRGDWLEIPIRSPTMWVDADVDAAADAPGELAMRRSTYSAEIVQSWVAQPANLMRRHIVHYVLVRSPDGRLFGGTFRYSDFLGFLLRNGCANFTYPAPFWFSSWFSSVIETREEVFQELFDACFSDELFDAFLASFCTDVTDKWHSSDSPL